MSLPNDPSGLAFDVADDFLNYVDELEPITWQNLNDDGSVALQIMNTGKVALRRASNLELVVGGRHTLATSEIVTSAKTLVWHIPSSVFGDQEPDKGDLLIGTKLLNDIWIIQKVELQSFMTRYKLTCIQKRGGNN